MSPTPPIEASGSEPQATPSEPAALRRRRRLVVLLALTPALLMVVWLIALAGLRAVNPALRSPRTWTPRDRERLFLDPRLHWCDPHPLESRSSLNSAPPARGGPLHVLGRPAAHAAERGWPWRCKGRLSLAFSAFLLTPRPEDHALLTTLLSHPEPAIAVRAATLLAVRGELGESALRDLAVRLQRAERLRELELLCWSIGRTRARSCLPIVLKDFGRAGAFRRFAAHELLSPDEFAELKQAWRRAADPASVGAISRLELARQDTEISIRPPFFTTTPRD